MRSLTPLLATVGVSLLTTSARADFGDQIFKLLPADGTAEAAFGSAVDVGGGFVVVGSRADDDNGAGSGSAYLFDAATGAQLIKLLPDDGAAGDEFGFSVAIGNDIVVVGAKWDDDNGVNSGSAYLFDAGTGGQLGKLLPDDGAAGDEFGFAVAIDGGIVVVGAKRDDDNGMDSGSVYLFDAASGDQLDKLLPDDGAANDNFGEAIAIDAGIVAIGAHRKANGPLFLAGAAYLFDAATGDQLHKLLPDDARVSDFFGAAIAIDDGIVVVGAWAKSIVYDHSGAAYLFDASTGAQITRMVPADSRDRDNFGRSVAIANGTVAVASPRDDGSGPFNSGSAYLFAAPSGDEMTELFAGDGAANDEFGSGIAVAGGTLVIGAHRDDDSGANSGSAYVFDVGDGSCPADLVGDDGVVSFADLVVLLGGWGSDGPGADLAEPLDVVDFADLLVLLGAWGDCP